MERLQTCSIIRLNQQGLTRSEFYPYMRAVDLVESILPKSFRALHTIKIYLPSKTELVPVPKASSYLGAFGILISSNTALVVQDPSAPAPRVVHHDSVMIPKGFNCGLCRPATDGSLVYLLARTKQQSDLALGGYIFWVFVYDWKSRHGLRVRLPEVFPRQILAFSLYKLTSINIRKVAGGRSWGLDTRSSYKTGGI